jgi:site-specific recombinase XerD
LIPTPDVSPAHSWEDAWLGYELHLASLGRSSLTIKARRSEVRTMARHATHEGHEPDSITKPWMQRYLLRQQAERKGNGYHTLYANLSLFWKYYAEECEKASPMQGIPRPRAHQAAVPVLAPDQFKAIFAACSGRDWLTVRNRAIIMLLLETGLRRFELAGLNLDDVDLRNRTVAVTRGKNGRARVSVFGDDSAQALHRWMRMRRSRVSEANQLFVSRLQDRLTPGGIAKVLHDVGARAGVPGLRPHLLRHAWTHFSLSNGMQEHDIMQLAGWTSTQQLGRYGAALARERALAAGRRHQVGKIIKGQSR